MTFDIKQTVTDAETGEYDEQAALDYQDAIVKLFAQSPEGEAYAKQHGRIGWTPIFLEYAMSHLGLTPPEMDQGDLDEVLFELFPHKVSVEATEAPDIVAELNVFWSFLGRAYELPNAPQVLRLLDDKAARRLQRELGNPANFGVAKSIVMQGQARGFDVTSQEGLDSWFQTYNSEIGMLPPLDPGGFTPLPGPAAPQKSGSKSNKAKNRRKMAKASRKQNRRK